METKDLLSFISEFTKSMEDQTLERLVLSKKRNKSSDLQQVSGRMVSIRKAIRLQLVFRHRTRDVTKNYAFEEGADTIRGLLQEAFLQAELITTDAHYYLHIYKSGRSKIKKKVRISGNSPDLRHDHQKKRPIEPVDNPYLKELGITTSTGKVKQSGQDKYRQINKYIEIVDGIIRSARLPGDPVIVDMGSGKGYLTFALYDYLSNQLDHQPKITGVEFRQPLVDHCNQIAKKSGYTGLVFEQGTILDHELQKTDILIALHACDTATDDAIYKGIRSNARIILCAPCCHKQVRKSMNPQGIMTTITDHGILFERQAEILTDAIRALLLEAYGYKTRVFEFISTRHTPKNVMISAVKNNNRDVPDSEVMEKVARLKRLFGLPVHYLESLLM